MCSAIWRHSGPMDWMWLVVMTFRQASALPDDRWAVRLAGLDTIRSQAFAAADPRLLDRVYVTGSEAGRTDAAAITSYARRDGRVVGAQLRVLSCRVVRASAEQARLDVVDVLTPARVVWSDGSTTALPLDQPTRRTITVRRTSDGWRIGAVEQIRPARSAALTQDRGR